jgi:CspA family cold shock protein
MEIGTKMQGVVKWFNSSKGYGFIQSQTGEDFFVHYTSIQGDGYRTLDDGVEVEFEVGRGEKGLMATRVVVLN